MLVHAAEESFQKGMIALRLGRITEAQALFEAAIELERKMGTEKPQPRYVSYYGLCLGLRRENVHTALKFCREAAAAEEYNADMCCNLGRVLLRAGRRKEAHKTLAKGLRLQPDHRECRQALSTLGVRRPPVLPFLPRGNFLNVMLGRMRAARAV